MNDCIFCQRKKIFADILYETKNFFVKVGFGIITAGHVMIISRNHYPCFAELPKKLLAEYEDLKGWLVEKITKDFARPFMIEYGIWGQTVFHAHTHFIPHKAPGYEIKSIVGEMFLPGNHEMERANWKHLQQVYRDEKAYVSVEEEKDFYVCHIKGISEDSNLEHLNYRAYFASVLKLPGVKDWQEMTKEDIFLDERKRNETKSHFAAYKHSISTGA